MTLEDEIAQELASRMQSDMDFHILSEMLVKLGWTKLFVKYNPPERSWVEIKQWAEDNCRFHHQEYNGTWLFENQQDANWFALRWV